MTDKEFNKLGKVNRIVVRYVDVDSGVVIYETGSTRNVHTPTFTDKLILNNTVYISDGTCVEYVTDNGGGGDCAYSNTTAIYTQTLYEQWET